MTTIANTKADIPKNSVRADKQLDGTYLVYGINDTLPVETQDPIAITTQAAKDASDAANAKANAKLSALSAMTPAQVIAWVAANVTNLAQAQSAIETLAIAVSVLARRL